MMGDGTKPWLSYHVAKPGAAVRLFCLPHAGGGAMAYRAWSEPLGPSIEVCPVQLPGREHRMREPAVKRVTELVPRLANAFESHWDAPFALFGHSMGALLAFELARELRRRPGRLPVHLFLAGRLPPRELDPDPPLHDLPEPAFVERLRDLNGTPAEVLESREMRELLFPTLRADFALCAGYAYRPEAPLDCPVTVLAGREDHARPPARLEAWRAETSGAFELRVFPGDHFFPRSATREMLTLIRARLET